MINLKNSPLFKNIDDKSIKDIEKSMLITKKQYDIKEVIITQGNDCNFIGIVKSGKLILEKIYPSGDIASVITLSSGNIFGEGLIFGKSNKFPVTISCEQKSEIYFITKENLLTLFNLYPQILQNYLFLMSNRLLKLNEKIKYLSLNSIEKKVAHMLLKKYMDTSNTKFELNISREKMAKLMGATRPSLSRVLGKMKKENIIDYNKNTFIIIDIDRLNDLMYKWYKKENHIEVTFLNDFLF